MTAPDVPWEPPDQAPADQPRLQHPEPPRDGSTRFGSHDRGIPWSSHDPITDHTARQKDHERWPWA